jgi:single-strand DNA-binding protein
MPDFKMPQINCIFLSGRLLRDPELKYGANGTAYIKTGIAVDDGFGDKKKTYFLDIAAFGKLAERMHPELSKGVPVYVEGRLSIEEWEAKDGSGKRSRVVVLCNRLDRLTWPDKAEYLDAPPKSPPDTTPAPDDDIPF